MIALDLQEQILDKLNTLIVVLNNDGSIDYVSRSATQLLGYEPVQLLGQNWWEKTRFTKPEGLQIKNKIVKLFNEQRASVSTFEHLLKTAEGGQKWFSWNISSLNDGQLIGIGHDITAKKQNEKKLMESNRKLLEQNKDITDSIYYAQRIQQSILQPASYLEGLFSGSFLLYKPKDIVSGDYYFFHRTDRYTFVAAVDCTGHGVPGAMMSMVANSIFKEVFINSRITDPALILESLDTELEKAINNYPDTTFSDGMDIALVRIEHSTKELCFAGAFRPLFIYTDGDVTELRGNRYPIGFYSGIEKKFTSHSMQLKPGDCLYLLSDGYIDQFGGERNKKLNRSNFKDLIRTISDMSMDE
ncbi:MAG: SpoIIE family protein phosphatase, partial [Bacteroidia bacterium]